MTMEVNQLDIFACPLNWSKFRQADRGASWTASFSIGSITQVSISPSVERWQVPRENVLHVPSFFFRKADVEAFVASEI
jgi:hypothetical protein